ncbi:hypothetical protein GOP47_0001156, partial [Adiantum capillus-veneris]
MTGGGRARRLAVRLAEGWGVAPTKARLEGEGGGVWGVVNQLREKRAQMAPESASLRNHARIANGGHDNGVVGGSVQLVVMGAGTYGEKQEKESSSHASRAAHFGAILRNGRCLFEQCSARELAGAMQADAV